MTTCDLDRMARDNVWEKVRTDFISFDGVFLPQEYERFAHAVENFEVNDDDTWVCSFQKSGDQVVFIFYFMRSEAKESYIIFKLTFLWIYNKFFLINNYI